MAIWVISPPMAYGTEWRVIAVASALVWIACEVTRSSGVVRKPTPLVLAATGFVLYTLLIELIIPDITTITHFFQIWILCLFLVISESFARRGIHALAPFFYIVLLLLPIWSIATLIGYETVAADASRTMSRSSAQAEDFAAMGIGGYGFVYTSVLALPVLAFLSLKWPFPDITFSNNRTLAITKWIVHINFALSTLVIINAGYTIALITAITSIALLVTFRAQSRHVLMKSATLALALLCLFVIFYNPVINAIEELATGTEYSEKVEDIKYTLEYGNVTGSIETRWERYTRSIELFFQHPILGTLTFDDVGKHSSFLDTFAQYGFFIGLLFSFILLFKPLNSLHSKTISSTLAISILFLVIMIPLLNRIFGAFGCVLFLFYPAALAFIKSGQNVQAQYLSHTASAPPKKSPFV